MLTISTSLNFLSIPKNRISLLIISGLSFNTSIFFFEQKNLKDFGPWPNILLFKNPLKAVL